VAEKLGGRNRLIVGKGGRGKKKAAGVEVVDVTRQLDVFTDDDYCCPRQVSVRSLLEISSGGTSCRIGRQVLTRTVATITLLWMRRRVSFQ
jgi:hypothetical protein